MISKVYDRYPKSIISLQAALWALERLENCPFFAQSQKWGWNNGRSKKRRKSGKGRKSGKNGMSESSTGVHKPRKLSIFCTEPEGRTK